MFKQTIAGLVIGLTAAASFAAEPPVWKADFEGQFPGEAPKGWKQHWGKKIDADVRQISNMEVLGGNNSMMIERSGTDSGQWGFGTEMKDVADGTAVLTVPFQIQGNGKHAFNFNMEIFSHPYQTGSRFAVIGFANGNVTLTDGKWKNGRNLGPYEASKWYRIVLKMPTLGGKQTEVTGRLDKFLGDGKWENGKDFTLKTGSPKGKWGWLLIVPNPGSKFKAYFDEITMNAERKK